MKSVFVSRKLVRLALVTTLLAAALGLQLLTAGALAAAPAQPAGPALRRFALIASANDGGAGRARLRFADTDAAAMSEVLQSLGGLAKSDLVLVPSATPTALAAAFDRIRQSISEAGTGRVRRELFVYYSGHSDEEGLMLGGQRVPYRQLRSWIDGAGADVRIAILDSCASGALLRLKGGNLLPPFLTDLSTDARGHAFLTASSADEAAQESDRIGAAFFTHYLVSGLRGAADANRNGHVTLHEAYQFANHETLRSTERTAAGPQHPRYDFQLAGTGDFVMTDLSATGAALVLDENVAGRIYVRDQSGRLLVELRKEPSYPVELGLGPGNYQVSLDADGRPFEAQVQLSNGRRSRLGRAQFLAVASTMASVRGGPAAGDTATTLADAAQPTGPYRRVPFEFVLAPGVRTGGNDPAPVLNNFVLGIVGHSHALQGTQLSMGGNIVDHQMKGAQLATGFNLSRGTGRGIQLSAGANIALGAYEGLQISDVNIGWNDFRGAQLGVLNWISGRHEGAQLSVLNHSGGGRAAQLGVVGISRGHLDGLQIGVANATAGLRGAQLGVANLSGATRGLGLGVLNIHTEMKGAQISVINIGGKVRGLQLGVINIAESVDGASIGIFNFVGDGYHRLALWSSDLLPTNLGFKLGSKHVYTLFGFGVARGEGDKALYGSSMGLGVHITPIDRLFVDIDAVGTHFGTSGDWSFNNQAMGSLRVNVGYQLFKHLAITAGPAYNVYVRKLDGADHTPGLGWFEHTTRTDNYEIRKFPGFLIGLQI